MKIVAIDFETANSSFCSACSLGICIYENGVLYDQFEWYIKPPKKYCFFTNTFVHGITYQDIKDAPSFDFYYDKLVKIFDDAIIVAHNAKFDLTVLNNTLDFYGLKHFENSYFDTVIFSRKVFPNLINHKLNTVSEHLGLTFHHHNAASDAYCCMMIVLKAMELASIYDVSELLSAVNMSLKHNM